MGQSSSREDERRSVRSNSNYNARSNSPPPQQQPPPWGSAGYADDVPVDAYPPEYSYPPPHRYPAAAPVHVPPPAGRQRLDRRYSQIADNYKSWISDMEAQIEAEDMIIMQQIKPEDWMLIRLILELVY